MSNFRMVSLLKDTWTHIRLLLDKDNIDATAFHGFTFQGEHNSGIFPRNFQFHVQSQ